MLIQLQVMFFLNSWIPYYGYGICKNDVIHI